MSTRSIILVTGLSKYKSPETVRIYKHSDGYPTGNLPVIADALKRSIDQQLEKAEMFKEPKPDQVNVGQLVGNILGAAVTVYGMGASVDQYDDDNGVYKTKFSPKHLGIQEDLEWIYLVNLNDSTVSIYGGGYTGKGPQDAYKKGLADPFRYAECLIAEYQDGKRVETQACIDAIEALGFKVKYKPSKPRRASKRGA